MEVQYPLLIIDSLSANFFRVLDQKDCESLNHEKKIVKTNKEIKRKPVQTHANLISVYFTTSFFKSRMEMTKNNNKEEID